MTGPDLRCLPALRSGSSREFGASRWVALPALLGLVALVLGCEGRAHGSPGSGARATFGWVASLAPGSAEQRCRAQIAVALEEPGLAVPVGFEAQRTEILARAKGAPVLLVEEPARGEVSPEASLILAEIETARAQATALFAAYPKIVQRKSLAREVLLRDGYLYADSPSLAFGLSHVVKLEDLFSEARLWLQRGADVQELTRTKRNGEAVYVEAHPRGLAERRARLLFLDRVATDPEALAQPLHREIAPVRHQLGFDSARVRHVSEHSIVLDAVYGTYELPTLLMTSGAQSFVTCEALPDADRDAVMRHRAERRDRGRLVGKLKQAIATQIDEGLPFDEPRTEFGQEDGKLREAWLDAYVRRRSTYVYNEDRYWVFGPGGRPAVPQVCIDFIADSFERASGSWFLARGVRPGKTRGGVDFDELELPSRRRVADFIAFADAHPQWFDVWRPDKLVPLSGRRRFFDFIAAHRKDLEPGDVVIIYGMRDDGEPHYHSFFVYDADPLTGMPTQLASNAVLPQVRSWEGEMHNAPRRSIRVRIRPRSSWLAEILGDDTEARPAGGTPE
jgi:hypothetical protein